MRPSPCLSKLHLAARRRLVCMRCIILRASTDESPQGTEAKVAFVTIECWNLWRLFVRSYYLSCGFSAVTIAGTRVNTATQATSENQVIGWAVNIWKKNATPRSDGSWNRRDEPTWQDPNFFIRACEGVGFSNIADIKAAFSTPERTFQDMPVFRNFFAHREGRTQKAAQLLASHYAIPSRKRPSAILLSRPPGRPQSLILEWLDHIAFTVEYLCT